MARIAAMIRGDVRVMWGPFWVMRGRDRPGHAASLPDDSIIRPAWRQGQARRAIARLSQRPEVAGVVDGESSSGAGRQLARDSPSTDGRTREAGIGPKTLTPAQRIADRRGRPRPGRRRGDRPLRPDLGSPRVEPDGHRHGRRLGVRTTRPPTSSGRAGRPPGLTAGRASSPGSRRCRTSPASLKSRGFRRTTAIEGEGWVEESASAEDGDAARNPHLSCREPKSTEFRPIWPRRQSERHLDFPLKSGRSRNSGKTNDPIDRPESRPTPRRDFFKIRARIAEGRIRFRRRPVGCRCTTRSKPRRGRGRPAPSTTLGGLRRSGGCRRRGCSRS